MAFTGLSRLSVALIVQKLISKPGRAVKSALPALGGSSSAYVGNLARVRSDEKGLFIVGGCGRTVTLRIINFFSPV